jgi:hypothetical protein
VAYAILGTPKPAFFDSSGAPLASGTVTVQDPDDSSAKNSYPTAADADANTNGVSTAYTLDSRGEIATQLWGRDGEDYKIIVKDSSGSTIYTLDEIRLPAPSRRPLTSFTSGDATPSVAEGNMFRPVGTTTITDFDDGQVGDVIYIKSGQNVITIQDNSAIVLRDNVDFELLTGDSLTLCMFVDQVWTEIGRSYGSGQTETVTTTNVITEGENGRTYFLNTAGGFTSTLPAPADGLKFKFIVKAAPSGASYTVVTNSSANIIYGTMLNAGTGTQAAAEDTITFVDGSAAIGDWVEVVSDGTNWYMIGFSSAAGGITTAAT